MKSGTKDGMLNCRSNKHMKTCGVRRPDQAKNQYRKRSGAETWNVLTRLTSQLANVCKPITRAGILISRHSGESAGTNWTVTHSPGGCLEPVKKLGN